MEEIKEKKIFIYNYLITFLISGILLIIVELFQTHVIVPIILILVGISNIISIYTKEKLLMTPITIFSLIWLILIPLSSFEYPAMREMTNFEWKIVLLFILFFCIGAILSTGAKKEKKDYKRKKLSKDALNFNFLVLVISTFSLIIMFILFGGIPLFYSDANIGKNLFRSSSVINTLTYFGAVAILIYAMEDIRFFKDKKILFFSSIYIILLIFTAERYFVTILFMLCLYIFCKIKINTIILKKFIIIILIILAIFIFVLQFRGNTAQKQMYFIDTGIYDGTAKELTATEIFRYLGMQERLLTPTFEGVIPGISMGTLTFSPLLKILGISPIEIPNLQIYGYTSKSIITKLYCDFGYLWGLVTIIISFIINTSYINYTKENKLFKQYFNLIWLVFLTFSFYAYFDNLIIFYLHFPIYIKFIEIYNYKKG